MTTTALGKPRNVKAEQVAEITEGAGIGAEARKLEGEAFAPTQEHEHSMNVWRPIAFFFKRLGR